MYLLNVRFSMSLFPNNVEITVWFFVCSSLKRLSSCLFSEVFLPLSNSTILSGPTERYYEVDNKLSFKMASLEASKVCSLAWILSPESIPPTIDTREIFSFPSIWVISSSTSVHFIAPPLVFFHGRIWL